jgi:hypothetical protein
MCPRWQHRVDQDRCCEITKERSQRRLSSCGPLAAVPNPTVPTCPGTLRFFVTSRRGGMHAPPRNDKPQTIGLELKANEVQRRAAAENEDRGEGQAARHALKDQARPGREHTRRRRAPQAAVSICRTSAGKYRSAGRFGRPGVPPPPRTSESSTARLPVGFAPPWSWASTLGVSCLEKRAVGVSTVPGFHTSRMVRPAGRSKGCTTRFRAIAA